MHNKEIENVIAEYLENPKAEYAVMINGDWGSGKTYFLTHSLMKIIETIDSGKNKRRKYAYVSLYGVKSIEDISKDIIFQCFGKNHKKKIATADTVMETASNILTASLGVVSIDLSKVKSTLAKIDINNWILCFDDLERCCLPINQMLGYMNHLVEHNKCKVIVLANEKEIGKITLNQRLEDKYHVILSGRKLLWNEENNSKVDKGEGISVEDLQKGTVTLFNEDILYKSIREKVIGLTIKYEPEMEVVYDSLILDYGKNEKSKKYLTENKEKILKYFANKECYNLRTLICVLGHIQKVYDEMISNKYDTVKYFDKIMELFLKYIVFFTIYYRNGGKVSDLGLTTEIGYVELGRNIYSRIRGFKCLEKYCTTLSFSEEDFSRVVVTLRQECEEEEKRYKKSKVGLAKAYGELMYWWEKEDDDVRKLIEQIRIEIKQDKYPFNSYQGIIGQLLVLEHYGYEIGDMNTLIDEMNQNIEKSDEIVDIERNSFSFEGDTLSRAKYEEYVSKLKLKSENKNHTIKESEVSQCMASKEWAEKLLDYCDKHFNEFLSRYGFIDLLDIEKKKKKIRSATAKELYLVKDMFKTVYGASNINDFFINDKENIEKLLKQLEQIEFEGINKPLAKKTLEFYLKDIITRLE